MDTLSPLQRSELMSRIRGKDTAPEWIVRRAVHGLGYRYRLHVKALPGTPDLVFSSRRKVIFVSGCFWHAHSCGHRSVPKTRSEYWVARLSRNQRRDRRVRRALRRRGWSVLTVWECQLRDTAKLQARLLRFLDPPAMHS